MITFPISEPRSDEELGLGPLQHNIKCSLYSLEVYVDRIELGLAKTITRTTYDTMSWV
jgi:hypothetical protein